jgi:DNA-binding response OmpR family regulator
MGSSDRKIVCVDDDDDDLSFLRDAIHAVDDNYEVIELNNGLDAIKFLNQSMLKDDLPCLVLLDINMPFLDGKQTLEKIRSELGLTQLPVIVLTSSQNPNDRALLKSKGVDMYTKPMNVSELHAMVKKFLLHCS